MKRLVLRAIAALITFFIGVSCVSAWLIHRHIQNRDVRLEAPVESSIPADTFITLERNSCYGLCPAYFLAISAEGTVIFNATYWGEDDGIWRARRSGVIRTRISQEQVQQLIAEFERANYFSLQDSYRDARDGCPSVATDSAWAYTSIQINGRRKSVEHYQGCIYAGSGFTTYPRELTTLESRIDEIVNISQWLR